MHLIVDTGGTVRGVYADVVLSLEQTGARPFSEVCKVTAADVDLEKGTWTLDTVRPAEGISEENVKMGRGAGPWMREAPYSSRVLVYRLCGCGRLGSR